MRKGASSPVVLGLSSPFAWGWQSGRNCLRWCFWLREMMVERGQEHRCQKDLHLHGQTLPTLFPMKLALLLLALLLLPGGDLPVLLPLVMANRVA